MAFGVGVVLIVLLTVAVIARGPTREGFTYGKRIVYIYTVDWCGWCETMRNLLYTVARDLGDTNVKVYEINETSLAGCKGCRGPSTGDYPVIVMLDEFGKQHRYNGGGNYEKLRRWIIAPARLNL